MNRIWRHMAMSVFEKQDPQALTLEEIDQAIDRFPYFAVLHFIKTGKLVAGNNAEVGSTAEKTALYFSNPHWLQFQLSREDEVEASQESLAETMTTPAAPELYEALENFNTVSVAEIGQVEKLENYDDKRLFTGDLIDEEFADEIIPAVETEVTQDRIADEIVPAVEMEIIDDRIADEIIPAVEMEIIDDRIADEIVPAVENTWGDESLSKENFPAGEAPPIVEVKEEKPLIQTTVNGTTENEPLIPLEPLYTIDYFASQGIKLPVDENPDDKLGRKLKSFTEWLKSMKKIHPEKIDRQLDQHAENNIRTAAEYSNDNKDVYTEALAEVYLKQGLEDKAVDVFKKLSLLDPSKSAYFAARIREIKEI